MIKQGCGFLKRLGRDTSGALAVWAALGMPVMVGAAAFSVDASRLYNMEHDLQSGADALARAGAAELDGRGDSLVRAQRAVRKLVRNDQRFAADGRADVTVPIDGIRFLHSLPPSDSAEITDAYETLDPSRAKFVEVRLDTETVGTMFPTDLVAGTMRLKMDATSVAGRSARVCGAAPLFVCNPFEGSSTDLYDALKSDSFKRRQFQFKRQTGKGGKAGWGPGSFGFLQVPGYSGASGLKEAVGIDVPDTCFDQGGTVRLRTGNVNSLHQGFNTRFDIYEGAMKKERSNPRYAPAANVTHGVVRNGCSIVSGGSGGNGKGKGKKGGGTSAVNAMGLPRDSCHAAGTCEGTNGSGGGQMGGGDWDIVSYMERNHNKARSLTIGQQTWTFNYGKRTVTPSAPPSRYQVYRWEVDTNCVPGEKTYGRNASTDEEGTPQCHLSGPSTADVDRRVLHAAVLNCAAIEASGGMTSSRDLPVETFVKVFLTEPVGSGSESTIFGEIIGPVETGDYGVTDRAEVIR